MITEVVGTDGIIVYTTTTKVGPPGISTDIRYNGNIGSLEISNGYGWESPSEKRMYLSMPSEWHAIRDWASTRMKEEQEFQSLAKESATIRDLLNQIEEKKEQLRAAAILVK